LFFLNPGLARWTWPFSLCNLLLFDNFGKRSKKRRVATTYQIHTKNSDVGHWLYGSRKKHEITLWPRLIS